MSASLHAASLTSGDLGRQGVRSTASCGVRTSVCSAPPARVARKRNRDAAAERRDASSSLVSQGTHPIAHPNLLRDGRLRGEAPSPARQIRFQSQPRKKTRRSGGAAAGKRFACGSLGLGNGTEHWVYMGLMNASNWADSLSPCKIEEDQKMEEDQDTT